MVSRLPSSRVLLVAGVLTVALAACGRRGALEAPPSAAASAQTQAREESTLPSPVGTPRRSHGAGFVVPRRSFILDPLL